jgi:undecaprenyl-diphosphatase
VSLYSAILLGAVQGLTEFLPVSSSGHLVIAQHFLTGFDQPGVLFDVVLHLGTLGAVLIYLRHEISLLFSGLQLGSSGRAGRRLILALAVGTLPAVVAALLFKDFIERSFEDLWVVGVALCVTGMLLLFSRRFRSSERQLGDIGLADALFVGAFQSVALLPGISRSGTTIVSGLGRGLAHGSAARFSFLLSIPAILGAAVFNVREVAFVPGGAWAGYLAGFLTAFAIGYLAIGIVIKVLASERFHLFGYYCLGMGGLVIVYVALDLA